MIAVSLYFVKIATSSGKGCLHAEWVCTRLYSKGELESISMITFWSWFFKTVEECFGSSNEQTNGLSQSQTSSQTN